MAYRGQPFVLNTITMFVVSVYGIGWALAAAVGAGLWGIENKIDPGEPIKGNSYAAKHPVKSQLPRTLMDAAGRLKASKPARSLFGDAFVDHYSATREWEEREFRKAITDWELDRYMEII